MEFITNILRGGGQFTDLWRAGVILSALYLIGLGATGVVKPSAAAKFLRGFAKNPAVNLLESVLRGYAGLSFMGASPDMRYPALAFWIGAVLFLTAIPMAFLSGPHKQYSRWANNFIKPILPIIAIASLLLGGFIFYMLI